MRSVQFIFGVHNHQPVGNFDAVFQEAFDKSYRPFVEIAQQYPSISLTLHFSGALLEWLEDNEPSFLDQVAVMVRRGNVEILSGGFYEPVLGIIPDRDKVGQIQKLTHYILNRFGYQAEGLWLTERVWEPHLAKPIRDAGIKYVTVDDYHFRSAGLAEHELIGYFLTEEQNEAIGVFPISQHLRYAIPFKEPEETLVFLRNAAEEGDDVTLVMVDDGEKFGLWPGTHSRCYGQDQWLDRFLTALEDNSDWIETTTFGKVFNSQPPKGRVYLPTASYFEMSQWCLPAQSGEQFDDFVHSLNDRGEIDRVRPFVQGGIWRNFLVKYPESNWMHKRMIQVSEKLATRASHGSNRSDLEHARDELWRSQCNCAYWHGIFGGLYLPHLRHAVYQHLLEAEHSLDRVSSGVRIARQDVDLDGLEEIEVTTPTLKAFFSPRGGTLCELDFLPARFNLINSLRRHRESYHRKVARDQSEESASGSIHEIVRSKEPNLKDYLVVDASPRHSLVDHFWPLRTQVEELMLGKAREQADFNQRLFTVETESDSVTLSCVGNVLDQSVKIVKRVAARRSALNIRVQITNLGHQLIDGLYAIEFNFSLLGGRTNDRYYEVNGNKAARAYLDAEDQLDDVSTLSLITEWEGLAVQLHFPQSQTLWRYPVQTISSSESGFERIYQSSVVLPVYSMKLSPDEHFSAVIDLQLSSLPISQADNPEK
ncbi:MAG: alpha-amylase/4-alpha-glucanotransferase domain-containing protein [Candidatus Neomarinimicrobiota bacterium]